MKKDIQDLENQLNGQQAADLDESLLDRLEAAAEGTLTELTEDEVRFEAKLRAIQPHGLSQALLENLESKVDGIPAPSQVHVLPFSRREQTTERKKIRKEPTWAAAAAAVALFGMLCSWWLDPLSGPQNNLVGDPSISAPEVGNPLPAPTSDFPTEFSRALSQTQDKGIIWPTNKEPHQVLKVTYTDRVSMKRKDGSIYEVEKPRVEYYLVPTDSH